jgi:hypothetical protein
LFPFIDALMLVCYSGGCPVVCPYKELPTLVPVGLRRARKRLHSYGSFPSVLVCLLVTCRLVVINDKVSSRLLTPSSNSLSLGNLSLVVSKYPPTSNRDQTRGSGRCARFSKRNFECSKCTTQDPPPNTFHHTFHQQPKFAWLHFSQHKNRPP